MSTTEAFVIALTATMALVLANRSLRTMRGSFQVKAAMGLIWAAIIAAAAAIATWLKL